MNISLINVLVLALFVVGGGLVALMVTITQRSYKQDEKSEHWVVYPGAEGESRLDARWTVVLDDPGKRPILVIKEIRALTGLGPAPAKAMIDGVPSTVVTGVDHSTATKAHAVLARAGAQARMAEA
ncbi:ribosomal protein L7/L12 [Glycomyces luteolus]|uniref:Ribosomal protein L7/L12 n=1 Tax=Glycomyces luteolus TaxID=2670330 RepID=A0A9X3PD57_9ACTN|nr:ribosomal protein L7/L12 [Glycomyces luteolus]MDA1362604.1 ribosomal protein L7/L12 [Glycomyces luteolus]